MFRILIGGVANFFDTLGIGSFATTTAIFRLRSLVADDLIPGTLNVGHALPTLVQAVIFIGIVQVNPLTLISMVAAAVLGAWLGAGWVSRMPRPAIQAGMGIALILAAVFLILTGLHWLPGGGDAVGLEGVRLAWGLLGNFILGGLMTLGIGLYAPCMILTSVLGMNPLVAFPIMMGSCACLMPVASLRFIRTGKYDFHAAAALALGGVPAVLVAAFLVRSLPLIWLRWLVVAVVLYTAVTMLVAASESRFSANATVPEETRQR